MVLSSSTTNMPNKPSLSSERFVRNTRGYRTVRVGRSDTRAIVRNVSKSDPPGPAPRKLSPRPPALRSYMSAQPRPAKTEEQVTTKGKGKTKPKDKGKSAEKSSGSCTCNNPFISLSYSSVIT